MGCRSCSSGIPDGFLEEASLEERNALTLEGKKIIILGERDGIPAPTIEQIIDGLGAAVVYSSTQCFV